MYTYTRTSDKFTVLSILALMVAHNQIWHIHSVRQRLVALFDIGIRHIGFNLFSRFHTTWTYTTSFAYDGNQVIKLP